MAAISSAPPSSLQMYSLQADKARDLPAGCAKLAAILDQQPLFKGKGLYLFSKHKVIALEKEVDARICGLFSDLAINIMKENEAWPIFDFWGSNCHVFRSDQVAIDQGLKLGVAGYPEMIPYKKCPVENLEVVFNQILSDLKRSWLPIDSKDYPDMWLKVNPEEFFLFRKPEKNLLTREDLLIRLLAVKWGLEGHIKCFNEEDLSHLDKRGDLYLWVRKTNFEKFKEKFEFQVEKPPC